MRHASWFLFLLCVPALSQSAPDNAAADAFKKHLQSMNLLHMPLRVNAKPIVIARAEGQKVCAIPLLKAKPPGTTDKMRIVAPPVTAEEASRELKVRVPAPACE